MFQHVLWVRIYRCYFLFFLHISFLGLGRQLVLILADRQDVHFFVAFLCTLLNFSEHHGITGHKRAALTRFTGRTLLYLGRVSDLDFLFVLPDLLTNLFPMLLLLSHLTPPKRLARWPKPHRVLFLEMLFTFVCKVDPIANRKARSFENGGTETAKLWKDLLNFVHRGFIPPIADVLFLYRRD